MFQRMITGTQSSDSASQPRRRDEVSPRAAYRFIANFCKALFALIISTGALRQLSEEASVYALATIILINASSRTIVLPAELVDRICYPGERSAHSATRSGIYFGFRLLSIFLDVIAATLVILGKDEHNLPPQPIGNLTLPISVAQAKALCGGAQTMFSQGNDSSNSSGMLPLNNVSHPNPLPHIVGSNLNVKSMSGVVCLVFAICITLALEPKTPRSENRSEDNAADTFPEVVPEDDPTRTFATYPFK